VELRLLQLALELPLGLHFLLGDQRSHLHWWSLPPWDLIGEQDLHVLHAFLLDLLEVVFGRLPEEPHVELLLLLPFLLEDVLLLIQLPKSFLGQSSLLLPTALSTIILSTSPAASFP